ncbi:NAD(P)H-hydrate dehydratase [Anaerosoma tenue]|uniref:NAD(P)H-hydrate dehydratase n=1 Tax=Anaerosoma tenue TaxID=2933588 RepID=UPI002260BD91|nr:NAD(P)H-hydrate dehydratase [Anaerosoma tenue]MCK8115031.1 sugar kinase [Anaerosoma tenue]
MTLLVIATYPVVDGPVLEGPVTIEPDGAIAIGGTRVPSSQGTSAMLGAAVQVAAHLGTPPPHALVAGDIGRGDGTRAVYERLSEAVKRIGPSVIAFHYMQPVMALMRKAVHELAEIAPDALLVADAGGMYAAKAAGLATRFELMTPDVGEVGFLADPEVTHPAYVSHYLFGNDGFDPVALAATAHETGGASRVLLIKGVRDHIAEYGAIAEVVDEPCVPELEAIGGTGDTVAGLASAFLAAGFPTVDAARCASLANREAGRAMGATPAMHASDLVAALPGVLADNLCRWGGACVV